MERACHAVPPTGAHALAFWEGIELKALCSAMNNWGEPPTISSIREFLLVV